MNIFTSTRFRLIPATIFSFIGAFILLVGVYMAVPATIDVLSGRQTDFLFKYLLPVGSLILAVFLSGSLCLIAARASWSGNWKPAVVSCLAAVAVFVLPFICLQ